MKNRSNRFKLVRWFGVLSMFVFLFMYTSFHDRIVTLVGCLGTLALIPYFLELPSLASIEIKILATLSFILSVVVFISFETKLGFYYLPLIQKFTFLIDTLWVGSVGSYLTKNHVVTAST